MPKDQLALVQRLAERQETEAGARLSVARDAVDQSQSQLSQVLDYRKDYYRLATGTTDQNIDSNRLRAARNFLSELDDIIGRQQLSLRQAELTLAQQQAAWIESKRRLASIKNLRNKRRLESDRSEEKAAQRLLDDLFAVKQAIHATTTARDKGVQK
ncbi:MAG: flagellar export protein FliJ [Gammaproteobacteria bacterium]|nr:flagellar export protein FliJ [Gammaproteobacteria bacterium]